MVEPVDPFGSGDLDVLDGAPGSVAADQEPQETAKSSAPPFAQTQPTIPTESPSPSAPTAPDELTVLATGAGVTDIEPAELTPSGAPGVAGWWDYMYVAIWLAPEPITPRSATPAGEIDVNGVTATRYDTEDGPMASFACNDRHILVGILGVDDNVIGTDPLPRYTQAVTAAAC